MIKYSVFVPVFNEAGNLKALYEEIAKEMNRLGSWEMIFVNDGSTDASLAEMKKISGKNITILDLQRNYGQAVAMDAGFRAAKGEYIISLDADRQNDPSDIPKLLKKLQDEDLDVVAGWRWQRKDPIWMLIITKTAKFLRSFIAKDKVHDSGCTLRIYKKSIVEDLELWGEMHRYIMAILGWKGAKIGEIKVNHRPRTVGKTKYTWKKSIRGFIDLLYIWFWKKFSGRPLHLFGATGLLLSGLGVLSGIWTIYLKIFNRVDLSDSVWFIMSFFLFFLGVQFFISGITLDLLIRSYYNTSKEKRYTIRKIHKK